MQKIMASLVGLGASLGGLLNTMFRLSGALSAVLLVCIAILVVGQIVARTMGMMIPSSDDLAAFCMAGSVFLGLAYTLEQGGHIRVELLLDRLPARIRKGTEIIAEFVMLLLVSHISWYSVNLVVKSILIHDVTNGVLPIPLCIPQSTMVVGTILLWLAIAKRIVKFFKKDGSNTHNKTLT